MKKLTLLFAALFTILTVSAKTIYFNAGEWNVDGNKFAVWHWVKDSQGAWTGFMTHVEEGIYTVDIADESNMCVFVSFASNVEIPDWEITPKAQTADLTIPAAPQDYYSLLTSSWSTYNVTVNVESVSLNAETLKIRPAQTYTLKATLAPEGVSNPVITWESSNPDVATVVDGKITTLAVGETDIKVTTEDGGKTATCHLTVSEDADALAGISIRFTTPEGWGDAYLYAWDAAGNWIAGAWPGSKVTTTDEDGYYVYTMEVGVESVNIIINNGNNKQTSDIEGITADVCYAVGDDNSVTEVPAESPETVIFDANEGVDAPVPATNEDLYAIFKPAWNAYYGQKRDYTMDKSTDQMSTVIKMVTDEKSGWKWLGDYVMNVSTAQGYAAPTGGEDRFYRFAIHNLFNLGVGTAADNWNPQANFTEAGKPEAWKKYYQFGTAPTREGYAFTGWYTEPACENKVDALAADFVGTLYAGWVDYIALENVAWETEPATEMIAGTRAELAIVLTPANTTEAACTWESSHPEIIEVAEGTVVNGKATTTITAKAAGENVTITATFANEKKLEVTINVTEKYTFVLQGGTLPAVPADNDALYEVFKVDYVEFQPATSPAAFGTINGAYKGGDIDGSNRPNGVAGYAGKGIIGFLTTNDYGWKWLGDYIIETTPAMKDNTDETEWRYEAQGFFSAIAKYHSLQTGDYSLAGLPVAWHPAYIFAHVPTKENSQFTGWYDNPDQSGAPLTALPAEGGELYAGWQSISEGTALENAEAAEVAVRKIVENGQIYIIRNGEKYTTTGILVK